MLSTVESTDEICLWKIVITFASFTTCMNLMM